MTVSEKMKANVNKIEQNKAHNDLDDKLLIFSFITNKCL